MIIEHFETLDVRKSHCHVCFRAITFSSLAVYLSFQCVVRLLLIYSWPIDTIAWINFEYTYSYRSLFSTKHLLGIDELWSHQLKSRYKHVRNNLDGDFFFDSELFNTLFSKHHIDPHMITIHNNNNNIHIE